MIDQKDNDTLLDLLIWASTEAYYDMQFFEEQQDEYVFNPIGEAISAFSASMDNPRNISVSSLFLKEIGKSTKTKWGI